MADGLATQQRALMVTTYFEGALLTPQIQQLMDWLKCTAEFTTELLLYVTRSGLHWKKIVNNFGDECRTTLDIWQPEYVFTQYILRHHAPHSVSAVFMKLTPNLAELIHELRLLMGHMQFKTAGRLTLHVEQYEEAPVADCLCLDAGERRREPPTTRGKFSLSVGQGPAQTWVQVLARRPTVDELREVEYGSLGVVQDIHNYPFVGRILIEFPIRIVTALERRLRGQRRRDYTALTLPYVSLLFQMSSSHNSSVAERIYNKVTMRDNDNDEVFVGRYELERNEMMVDINDKAHFSVRAPIPLLLSLLMPHRNMAMLCLFYDEAMQVLLWQHKDLMQASLCQVAVQMELEPAAARFTGDQPLTTSGSIGARG